MAVDFFLRLSGFMLARAYGAELNGRMSVADFAIKRLIRLCPLYTVGLLAAFLATLFALALVLNLVDVRVRTKLSGLARRVRLQTVRSDACKPRRGQF